MTGTPPITTRMGMLHYSGTLAKLNGLSASGLTSEVAAEQRQRFGPNNILEERRTGWLGVVKETAADPMIWLLAATSVLFAWTGDRVEALVLALAMIPILGMDAFLHRQTSVSSAALAGQLSHSAQVVRDRRESIIVCLARHGKRKALNDAIARAEKSDIPRITPYSYRHFMATKVRAVQELRVDCEQRSLWLGHGKKDTTSWYEKHDPEHLRECAIATSIILDKLDALTKRSLVPPTLRSQRQIAGYIAA